MSLSDIHEVRSGIPDKLKWQIAHLDCGDYALPLSLPPETGIIGALAGIERKASSDLLNSIQSGALADQLSRMLNFYYVSILLREGSIDPDFRTGYCRLDGHTETRFPYDAYANFIVSWQLRGVLLEDTRNKSHTVHRLQTLEKLFSKPEHTSHLIKRRIFSFRQSVTPRDRQLTIISELPGIGPELADALLTHLHSILAIAFADKKRLQQVPGIGPKLSEDIYEIVRLPYTKTTPEEK